MVSNMFPNFVAYHARFVNNADKRGQFQLRNGNTKTCNWAGKKYTPRKCLKVPVRTHCPDTCGLRDEPGESSQPSTLPSDQPSLAPSVSPLECDDNFNFILNLNYNQISLTDGCDANNICDANPIYAGNL